MRAAERIYKHINLQSVCVVNYNEEYILEHYICSKPPKPHKYRVYPHMVFIVSVSPHTLFVSHMKLNFRLKLFANEMDITFLKHLANSYTYIEKVHRTNILMIYLEMIRK